MPKQKTKKTVAKRFKITKTGKVLRGKQMSGHRRFHKSNRLRRTYGRQEKLNSGQAKVIKKLIAK